MNETDSDLPVGEWLTKNAKTLSDLFWENNLEWNEWLRMGVTEAKQLALAPKYQGKWVSVETVTVLFDKCAYIDFEGEPAFLCTTCRFYHGLKNGCYWEKERKELLSGSVSLPLCEKCKATMKVIRTRPDGCRYFGCSVCGGTVGEETEEWFSSVGEKQIEATVHECEPDDHSGPSSPDVFKKGSVKEESK